MPTINELAICYVGPKTVEPVRCTVCRVFTRIVYSDFDSSLCPRCYKKYTR